MSKVYYKGIDVSEWQGVINWSQVKNAGIEFVIPRASLGRATQDKIFNVVVSGAKEAGVDIPAIYHASYACTAEDAKTEADFVLSLCNKYKLPKSTVIFFDYEDFSLKYFNDQQAKKKDEQRITLTPGLVQLFAQTFCNRVTAAGYTAGVYFNQNWFVNWYDKGKNFSENWKRWLADLEGDANYPCDIHQYSFHGKVSGIKTEVDLDYFYYDYKTGIVEDEVKDEKPVLKPIDEVANECIQGLWGNGAVRKNKLTKAGYDYQTVQNRVNELVAKNNPKKKVTDEIVDDVIAGKYGNGDERKQKLEAAGYVYKEVQDAVNDRLSNINTQKNITKKVSPAQSFDNNLTGKYKITAIALNLRYIPGLLSNDNVVKVLVKDDVVQCWGYYTQKPDSKWMLVQIGSLTGFVDSKYLSRIN